MNRSASVLIPIVVLLFLPSAAVQAASYEDLMEEALDAYEEGEYREAAASYRAAARIEPEAEAYYGYLRSAYRAGEYGVAARTARKLLEGDTDLGVYRSRIETILARAEEKVEAERKEKAEAEWEGEKKGGKGVSIPSLLVGIKPSVGWMGTSLATFVGAHSWTVGRPMGRWVPYAGLGLVYARFDIEETRESWDTDYYGVYYKDYEREYDANASGLLLMPLLGIEYVLLRTDPEIYGFLNACRTFWWGRGSFKTTRRYYDVDGSIYMETSEDQDLWEWLDMEESDLSLHAWSFALGLGLRHAVTQRLSVGGEYSLSLYTAGFGYVYDDEMYGYRDTGEENLSGIIIVSRVAIVLTFLVGSR